MRDQIETWGDKEFEDCNMERSLKGGKKKKKTLKPSGIAWENSVWKLPTFLLYHFTVTATYLISFLPLFLSTRFINTDRISLLWLRYLYISILFFFFWVKNFYALFILIWDPFFFFFFFCVCVFVFILDKHPWHAIDVFVGLPECRFNSAIILQPKKLFYFTLVYLEISQVSFF